MITEKQLKDTYNEMVKSLHKEIFQRDITEEELNEGFKNLFSRMEEDLKEIRGFSDKEFERYMSRKTNDLMFSPTYIFLETKKIIDAGREEELVHSGKFKKLRELEIATRLCFANYKLRGETLMVMVQDNPDITLALTGGKSKNVEIMHVEIMAIPEIAKDKMGTDLPASIASFIKEKKFSKDYGRCSLLVNLDFDKSGLDYVKIAEAIQATKNNPYESIWLVFVSDLDSGMTVIQIFPKTFKVDYNLKKENLFY